MLRFDPGRRLPGGVARRVPPAQMLVIAPAESTMLTRQLNHVAIHVADVPASVRFYQEVLKLEPMPRPAFSFPGAWFRLGVDQELHLIGNREQDVHSHHRGNHYALLVDDIDAWENFFREQSIPYRRQTRPDGAHQVYVTDPDGHWIELCTEPPAASA